MLRGRVTAGPEREALSSAVTDMALQCQLVTKPSIESPVKGET